MPFSTHLLNSFTLLFPVGERFFIKSLQNVVKQIENEDLQKEINWFIKQEVNHAKEHEKYFQNLNHQGYNLTVIIITTNLLEKLITKNCSKEFKLSLTAAFEHMTALLAQLALEKNFFSEAESPMQELFEWHAFEEMEHRHVAFNVLREINSNDFLKINGMIVAFLIMITLSGTFTTYFLAKDKKLLDKAVWN
ncbi:metal-dependent hydrolase, partial [Bacteriovoracaceae bacterium]|nr:metal-dependent hydrolase [Bacteriovoracaceae bacterium]